MQDRMLEGMFVPVLSDATGSSGAIDPGEGWAAVTCRSEPDQTFGPVEPFRCFERQDELDPRELQADLMAAVAAAGFQVVTWDCDGDVAVPDGIEDCTLRGDGDAGVVASVYRMTDRARAALLRERDPELEGAGGTHLQVMAARSYEDGTP